MGLGAACGFTPGDVRAMSLWEFRAATGGYLRAHAPEDQSALSATEEEALWSFMEERAHVH